MKKFILIFVLLIGLAPRLTNTGLELSTVNCLKAQGFEETTVRNEYTDENGNHYWTETVTSYTFFDNEWIQSGSSTSYGVELQPLGGETPHLDVDPLDNNLQDLLSGSSNNAITNYSDNLPSGGELENDTNIDSFLHAYIEFDMDNDGDPDRVYLTDVSDVSKNSYVADLVNRFENQLNNKYGSGFASFPTVIYDQNLQIFGFGMTKDGKISIPNNFFALSYGNQLSVLLHEYTHWVHILNKINPVATDDNGNIIQFKTSILISRSSAEMKYLTEQKKWFDPNAKYTYHCSNYYKDEIAAHQAQLQGEKDGLYILTDEFRDMINDMIITYQFLLGRALDYENKYGRNPDGTEKQ